jgi:endonuclease/exonuclease/phosphatase family metal-dependent hydrolase
MRGPTAADSGGARPRVRVATLNVWGRRGDWAARRAVLAAGFAALRPDVVAFQETIVSPGGDQAAEILGDGYHLVHQASREADGQGISIASRYPVTGVREVDLQVTPRVAGFAAAALAAWIAVPPPAGPLLFVNHLPSWQLSYERERELQAVKAATFIEDALDGQDRPAVVAGDMDAGPDAASIRFWTGRQSLDGASVCYRDAWESAHGTSQAADVPPGDTFAVPENALGADWDWPFRRIDYILIRCGQHGGPDLAVESCQRIFDQPSEGVWASDHFGLIADLTPPPASGEPARASVGF